MTLTLLLGGARSGKSALAVELGRRHDERAGRAGHESSVVFVATAPITDEDMQRRVDRHREERPASWTTVEEQTGLADVLDSAPDHALVIVDCLTLWTSNLMWRGDTDDEIAVHAARFVDACRRHPGDVVAIGNEVGLGVHPGTELGRRYRDVLGRVNHTVAAAADPALFLVAGRALPLGDPWQTLDR